MEILLSFLLASVLLTLAPGPDVLLVLSESLVRGTKAGLLLASGLVCGLVFHTLIIVLGWGQFLGAYPQIVQGAKILGSIYFIYLSVQIFGNLNQKTFQLERDSHELNKNFKKGLIMNLLNPKVSLFFWLFFPGFLFSKELSLGIQYAVLGSVFILQASIVFFVVSVAASKISSFILSSSNYMYWTNFGQAVLLICIAFYFLV